MFLKDYEYNYLKDCKYGVYDNDPMFVELREFFAAKFGVYLYGYICDKADNTLKRNRLRYFVDKDCLNVFVDTVEGFGNLDRVKAEIIKNKFSELCVKYGLFEIFHNPNNYFAVSSEFDTEMQDEILSLCISDIQMYLKSFEEIKLMDFSFNYVFIFYEKSEDVSIHETSGLSDKISKHIFDIIKDKDYLDSFKKPQIVFDSIQVLNEKYDGNLFYYHR